MARLFKSPYWKVFWVATFVALAVRFFVLESFRVQSSSMSPNLSDGDLVLTSKLSYNVFLPFTSVLLFPLFSPERGTIAVHSHPVDSAKHLIKRIVAIGGDTVAIQNGVLIVNGRPAFYEKIPGQAAVWESNAEGKRYQVVMTGVDDVPTIEVPEDYFFVLGDNRPESVDSREWGPLPTRHLKAELIFSWHASSAGAPTPPKNE